MESKESLALDDAESLALENAETDLFDETDLRHRLTRSTDHMDNVDFLRHHFRWRGSNASSISEADDIFIPPNLISHICSDDTNESFSDCDTLTRDKSVDCDNRGKFGPRNSDSDSGIGSDVNDIQHLIDKIRADIVDLKKQDRSILRKFIEIRATLKSLRPRSPYSMYSSHMSSCSSFCDFTDAGGSVASLDERRMPSHRSVALLKSDEYLGEFRQRTVSLLPPRTSMSPIINRRYRSKEYV